MRKKRAPAKTVETPTHEEAMRKNIPSAEQQSILKREPEQVKVFRDTWRDGISIRAAA